MARLEKYRYAWKWKDQKDAYWEAQERGEEPTNLQWEAVWRGESADLNALIEKSRTLPPGEVVGAVLSFGRADGYAHYIVTKDKPLTLAWIPFADCYAVEEALIRGLRKQDILEELRRSRARAKWFKRTAG